MYNLLSLSAILYNKGSLTMNFLAHAHLSPDNKDIRIGNFIADSVKGSSYKNYSPGIAKGVLLHRAIDSFTDKHETVIRSRSLLREHMGKFAGVATDIYYDHFLARNWHEYSDDDLAVFTTTLYRQLSSSFFVLPSRIKRILPFMIAQNWLCGYANFNDLERVFRGMDRRTGYISGMDNAMIALKKNYDTLFHDFREFYPLLQNMVQEKLDI